MIRVKIQGLQLGLLGPMLIVLGLGGCLQTEELALSSLMEDLRSKDAGIDQFTAEVSVSISRIADGSPVTRLNGMRYYKKPDKSLIPAYRFL